MMETGILPLIMNKAQSERIRELCSRIEAEPDPHKFLLLVEELNNLLSAKDVPPTKDVSLPKKEDDT
jgi:hypothetical protein